MLDGMVERDVLGSWAAVISGLRLSIRLPREIWWWVIGQVQRRPPGGVFVLEEVGCVAVEHGGAVGIGAVGGAPGDERGQHAKAVEPEHAMLNRDEQYFHGWLEAIVLVHCFRAAGGHGDHRPLAHGKAAAVPLAAAVDAARGQHAIYPAFEDGGHAKPPQRELKDEHIAPCEFDHLGFDVGRERVVLRGVPLLNLLF